MQYALETVRKRQLDYLPHSLSLPLSPLLIPDIVFAPEREEKNREMNKELVSAGCNNHKLYLIANGGASSGYP